MAVEDHPVHPSTSFTKIIPGCHSKPRQKEGAGYYVQNRKYNEDGTFTHELVFIRDVMSKACRQNIYVLLPECAGCTAEKDIEYIERMKGLK